jgi:hypothetical protein
MKDAVLSIPDFRDKKIQKTESFNQGLYKG